MIETESIRTRERGVTGEGESLSLEISKELYKKMYLMRAAEDAIIKYYPENEMKSPMHMSYGQEAPAAGVCQVLTDQDILFSSYRSHAYYLGKALETDM